MADMAEAIDAAQHSDVEQVRIDARATRQLTEDELAFLLMLHAGAGRLRDNISLIGVSPALNRRLIEAGVSSLFDLELARHGQGQPGDGPTSADPPNEEV